MTIFDYAKKLEKDSEAFYRDLSESCFEIGTVDILTRLADEEVKHFKVLEALEIGVDLGVENSDILQSAANVIDQIRGKIGNSRGELPEAEAFALALDLEQKSWEFYEDCALKALESRQTEIFSKLAIQEHEHYQTVELMSEFFIDTQE